MYTVKNLATGQTATAASYKLAQRHTAQMIASDVERQVVRITGPDIIVHAVNEGFARGIAYQRAA